MTKGAASVWFRGRVSVSGIFIDLAAARSMKTYRWSSLEHDPEKRKPVFRKDHA
jgi:helix-turn-helix protein